MGVVQEASIILTYDFSMSFPITRIHFEAGLIYQIVPKKERQPKSHL